MTLYLDNDFLVESVFVVIAAFVYIHPLAKKEPLELRMMISFVFYEALFVGLALLGANSARGMVIKYALYLPLIAAMIYTCVQLRVSETVYLAIWSLLTSQFVMNAWRCWRMFSRERLHLASYGTVGMVVFYAAAYLIAALTIARVMPAKGKYYIGPRQLTLALICLFFFEVCDYMMASIPRAHGDVFYSMALVFAQFYCLTLLYVQTELFKKSAMARELVAMELLMKQQESQYALSRENIDLINRKCHDLKHQVRALRTMEGEESKEKYLSELEQSMEIYGAIVKTGNEVLDTILSEKSLLCQASGITINCVVDGSRLSFINSADLYAIMGNAIDNAMEAVGTFAKREMRLIDIAIYTRDKFLVINITNPLDRELRFRNGLPVSTKSKNGYHGFGLRSIRHNVRQYGGHISVTAEGGSFELKMVIPLPRTTT